MPTTERLYVFEIWQGGKLIRTVAEADPVTAERNATHLAVGYSQHSPDLPVSIRRSEAPHGQRHAPP